MKEVSYLNDSGEVCYVTQKQIIEAAGKYQKGVLYYAGKNLKTLVTTKKIFKSIESFSFRDESEFWEFIRSSERAGSGYPSSYGSVFRKLFKFPRVPEITRKAFSSFVRGGWQEAIKKGVIDEKIYQYDINSAYRHSASFGLPDLSSLMLGVQPNGKVILSTGKQPSTNRRCLLLSENIGDVDEKDVTFSVSFSRLIDINPVFKTIDTHYRRDHAKKISRAFWGSWISRRKLQCVSVANGKAWSIPNIYFNPVWSFCITERVRKIISAYNPYHVYVDSVIIPYQIPTGDKVGDWKLTGEWEPKTQIVSAGAIINKGEWVKHSGVRHEHVSMLKV